ncbi:penicillin acylase family protein [Cryobacterium tepidiphilum]|uniref:Penicillin acylase family protein n=1 Tax=Cryobacterium tepidiphilum TaxID=2486026 RepID=A0A3M8LGM9_9MICO|nr:penicillin acylase family protein [Cryobacterium tepidiphilum]RNE63834.1 penicillin acylase family protein [Cryobacterium tepidiphilum]
MGTDAPRSRRRRRSRPFLIALGIVAAVAVIVAGAGVWTVTRSFPTLSGEVTVPGLDDSVTVRRDDAGIPRIVADDPHDLFLAEGYVHAQDRFWEMDVRRHVTSGRLAELFGAGQVGTDAFIRTLGWRAVAEQEVAKLDPVTLGYYQSYADGVNAYLRTHTGADLSLEYVALGLQVHDYEPEPWTPVDSVSWLKAMAWDLRSNLVDEIDRALLSTTLSAAEVAALHPGYPYGSHPTILGGVPKKAAPKPAPAKAAAASALLPDLQPQLAALKTTLDALPELIGPAGGEIGSNSWVVSGAHTDTGKPLLANDPHLGPALPSVWYQVGLRCRSVSPACPFDVAGYSFSGMPGVIIGHNQKVAWGFTNLGPDVADLYVEKVTGDSYEYDGKATPLAVRNEKISVAGGDPVKLEIRSTAHGPIVSGLTGTAFPGIAAEYPDAAGMAAPTTPGTEYELSLQWTALRPGRTAAAIFALNAATDWAGFRAAAQAFDVPAQNLLYADVEGNIGYQSPGLIPIRTKGDGTVPVPGWSSTYRWKGFIPFEKLPHLYNPPAGFIVTANNAAVGTGYPYLITKDWDAGYRAERITTRLAALIAAKTPISAAAMSRIQADNYSPMAAALVPLLQKAKASGTAKEAQALFTGWDYQLDADSPAAAYYNVVWRTLLHDLFGDKLPESTQLTGGDRAYAVVTSLLAHPESPWWTNTRIGAIGQSSMLSHVLDRAAAEATRLMGPVSEWQWGTIHTLELRNGTFGQSGIAPLEWVFNRGPYELAGGSSVVNAVGWDATQGYGVNWLPSMRQVVSLADFDDSTWVNLTGASGHAFHPNYVDQTPLWQDHQTLPWAYSPAAVREAATNTLRLLPAP